MNGENPKTLLEAVRHFSDLSACNAYMIALKWPDGRIVCPKCGGEHVGRIASRRLLQCKAAGCRKQFSAKVGTIFEDSPLGLDKWLPVVWVVANDFPTTSAALAEALGVTVKSAWRMRKVVKLAMQTPGIRLTGGRAVAKEQDKTDDLARKLVRVPKKELAREERKWKRRRRPKKK